MKRWFKYSYLAIILLVLYLPITVLIIFSFNSGDSIRNFQDWSWAAYGKLFQQTPLWQSLSVTLIVAVVSTVVATILGTFGALGLSKTRKLTRSLTLGVTNIPLVNADIVTAVSLMLLFSAFAFNFGIFTLILAHISFDIPYVIITVLPKVRSIDNAQLEASQDLGATPWYTLRKVVLPTIKPAIIAGAAIAFAMSFDDFIISYFTGGNAANVSVYIYSLKRIQPYINAFSTIIIVIVALIVVSWNAYSIVKKQHKTRNDRIMDQTYRDKRIIRIEKSLNKHYLQLNAVKLALKTNKKKHNKKILFTPIADDEEAKYIQLVKTRIIKQKNLINNIINLEAKLQKEQVWVQDIKEKIIIKKIEKEKKSRARREKYTFLKWPWKLISISLLMMGLFSGAIALYVETNVYDLSVANWGQYITPEVLQDFENEYHVHVKYSTYDDNESLYAKLYTTNYDVMVPSDYMVAKLASEGRLLPLDPNKIGAADASLNTQIKDLMTKYEFPINAGDEKGTTANLLQYSMPYFWGDLVLIFNTVQTPDLLNQLGVPTTPDPNQVLNANWDVLQKAIQLNKKLVLSSDMKNLFALPLITLHYQNQWGLNTGTGTFKQDGNTFTDYVNPQDIGQITDSADWLKPIISSGNTRLQNDEIVDTVAVTKGWDVAVMYNGDLLGAMKQNTDAGNYAVVRPYMGTNVWDDNMVISNNTQHADLAYDFINYMMRVDVQEKISKEFGYTSPVQAALDNVKAAYPGINNWDKAYDPAQLSIPPADNPIAGPGYYNGLYTSKFDSDMQTQFNKLLTTQGNNNVTALFIELGILLIIIVGFVALIFYIR